MAKAAKKSDPASMVMDVKPLKREGIHIRVIGRTPLIYHAVAMKAMGALLLPRGPMNAAAKAENIKHDPLGEYRDSVYKWNVAGAPTRLVVPAVFFKSAMMSAALRLPGIAKTEVAQLVWVTGQRPYIDNIAVWGKPELKMDVVRLSGATNAPDIRTRAVLREWCAEFDITYATPLLTATAVGNLLSTAGMICGIGDYRQEKGKGSFGQFDMGPSDEEWAEVTRQGKAVQDEALQNPDYYDDQTSTLMEWFQEEIIRRGREDAITKVSEETGFEPVDDDDDFTPPPRANGRGKTGRATA